MNISPEINSLIDQIKNDRAHGASQLARKAANVLKVAAEISRADSVEQFLLEEKAIGEQLMQARPAMAPVFNMVNTLLSAIAGKAAEMGLAEIRQFAVSKSDEVVNNLLEAVARIAKHGTELIAGGNRIMTHSYSSTVVAVLKETFNKYGNITVITTRSGPSRSGETTARELRLYGIPVIFIDDTAIGLYMPTANKVIIGADRVCTDGKVVNGVGSYQLAIVAKRACIPFYVLCETLKFDPRLKGEEVDLEEKETSEVVEPGRLPSEVEIKNPYFDITPLELVSGIITENGVLKPEEVISYMKMALVV